MGAVCSCGDGYGPPPAGWPTPGAPTAGAPRSPPKAGAPTVAEALEVLTDAGNSSKVVAAMRGLSADQREAFDSALRGARDQQQDRSSRSSESILKGLGARITGRPSSVGRAAADDAALQGTKLVSVKISTTMPPSAAMSRKVDSVPGPSRPSVRLTSESRESRNSRMSQPPRPSVLPEPESRMSMVMPDSHSMDRDVDEADHAPRSRPAPRRTAGHADLEARRSRVSVADQHDGGFFDQLSKGVADITSRISQIAAPSPSPPPPSSSSILVGAGRTRRTRPAGLQARV